ncbi:MAG: hypothetical protein RJA36_2947 [Pseudomonadota bacterium]|jgi:cytochrome c
MKKHAFAALTFALGTWGCALAADTDLELARSKQCLGCHSIDKDTLAPALRNISAKFRTLKGAEATLLATIMNGSAAAGGPHWGVMKMPAPGVRPAVSEDEARQLAQWILGL